MLPTTLEVYRLPKIGGDKSRRHVIARDCDRQDDFVNVVYASGSPNESRNGAIFDFIDKGEARFRDGPFPYDTYLYYSRLTYTGVEDLEQRYGTLRVGHTHFRQMLSTALGVGTGSGTGYKAAAQSRRGHIVRFVDTIAEDVEARYGVVVTEPEYSLNNGYQTVVPLLNGEEEPPTEFDIVRSVHEEEWLGDLDVPLRVAYFAIPNIFTVLDRVEITWEGLALEDAFMDEIDGMMSAYFNLP